MLGKGGIVDSRGVCGAGDESMRAGFVSEGLHVAVGSFVPEKFDRATSVRMDLL